MSLTARFQHHLPQKAITRFAFLCAQCEVVWIKNLLIRYFCWRYKIKLHEAVSSCLADYPHFNAFFTRHLKPGLRARRTTPEQLASACDGTIGALGQIDYHTLLQAKGRPYTLSALLTDEAVAQPFEHGSYLTHYLSPQDYHRVHMPIDGTLERMIYVPGKLFSVNPAVLNRVDQLFARNERVIAIFNTQGGKLAVVMVGAMIVGSMVTTWHGTVCPPHTDRVQTWDYSDQNITYQQGDEIGYFMFGSTVILLTEKNASWTPEAGDYVSLYEGLTR